MTTPAGGGSTQGLFYNVASVATAAVTQAMVTNAQQLASQVGTQQVKVEVDTLQGFKNKVDALLQGLDSSPAANSNISRQQLQATHLGEGFGQANDLTSAYNQVHANLEQLSKTLSLQIQAMSASIDMAAKGYQNADEEQRQAFQSVLNQAASSSQAPAYGHMSPGATGPGSYASPASYSGSANYGTTPQSAPPSGGGSAGGSF